MYVPAEARRAILEKTMHSAQPRTFGALVRHLRDERGWTQEQLARVAGITVTSVSNLERGATVLPNAETVERLAAAFGLDPDEMDPRWLAERVAAQALSLAQRQAIKRVLGLNEGDINTILYRLAELESVARKRTRR